MYTVQRVEQIIALYTDVCEKKQVIIPAHLPNIALLDTIPNIEWLSNPGDTPFIWQSILLWWLMCYLIIE